MVLHRRPDRIPTDVNAFYRFGRRVKRHARFRFQIDTVAKASAIDKDRIDLETESDATAQIEGLIVE